VTEPTRPALQRFRLSAAPPLRALAIASTCALLGGFLILFGRVLHWSWPIQLLAGLVMAFGIALAAAALIMVRRLRSVLVLDDSAITVVRGARQQMLRWADIEEVNLRGQRLVLVTRRGSQNAAVLNPGGPANATFAALVTAIRARLDESRGYQQL
jgi:hypothetical protein